jgi:addiction module HigA family antidote
MKKPPHPGSVIVRECIERSGLTIIQAAQALGDCRKTVSELVNERCAISPEMAVRLSEVFPDVSSAEGWLLKQARYDLAHLRAGRVKLKRLEP